MNKDFSITLLDTDKHQREYFDCGIEALNHFLQKIANQHQLKDHSRTYILTDNNEPNKIAGFYTLTLATLNSDVLPNKLAQKHKMVQSAGLIARLAVSLEYQGKGLGKFLLFDALSRLLNASELVGFPVIFVDAKDGKQQFYKSYGFEEVVGNENKLFITIATLRMALPSKDR